MTTRTTRIAKDIQDVIATSNSADPCFCISTSPTPKDGHYWFVIDGDKVKDDSDSSLFRGGVYLGEIIFPETYPLQPPSIHILTPTGRPFPLQRIFTPSSWSPSIALSQVFASAIQTLLIEEGDSIWPRTRSNNKSHDNETTAAAAIRRAAKASISWNLYNHGPTFVQLFPQHSKGYRLIVEVDSKQRRQEIFVVIVAVEVVQVVGWVVASEITEDYIQNKELFDTRQLVQVALVIASLGSISECFLYTVPSLVLLLYAWVTLGVIDELDYDGEWISILDYFLFWGVVIFLCGWPFMHQHLRGKENIIVQTGKVEREQGNEKVDDDDDFVVEQRNKKVDDDDDFVVVDKQDAKKQN